MSCEKRQSVVDVAVEVCPNSKDGLGHCRCWWDCAPCCWCAAPVCDGTDCDSEVHQ